MSFFFFNDTATTEIYTLSLHDALPISLWMSSINKMTKGKAYTLSKLVNNCSPKEAEEEVVPNSFPGTEAKDKYTKN